MPTVKTVEVGFTFVYVDKRRKYTCKDFGLKSIPYGVPDDWNVKSYSDDMDEIVNCPHCGKKSNFWQLLYKQRNPHATWVRLRCLRKLLQHRTSHRKQMEK